MLKVVSNFKKTITVLVSALFFSLPSTLLMGGGATALTGATFDTDVRVHPSLTLNITSSGVTTTDITLNLDPASNAFDYQDLNVAVGTNNATGYWSRTARSTATGYHLFFTNSAVNANLEGNQYRGFFIRCLAY